MIAAVLASVLAVSAIADTTSPLPGTALRFGMESSRFGAAQGFQPAPGTPAPERQERAGTLRFFGIDAAVTLKFLDRRLAEAEFVIENASPQQTAYIEDDLVRRGYRRGCRLRERERSRCTWTGATRIEIAREGARITAIVRPLTREERDAAHGRDPGAARRAVAAAPADTMPILPGVLVGDSVKAHTEAHGYAEYPEAARRAGVQGVVRIHALVDTTGRVVDLRVARSIAELDSAAVAAIGGFRFRPFERDGRRVGAWVEIPVRFTIH